MSKLSPIKLNFLTNFLQFTTLKKRNQNIKHINYKIYYLLCQPETFLTAYKKISKNQHFLINKLIKNKLFFFGFIQAKEIAQKFKDEQYEWNFYCKKKFPKVKIVKIQSNISFFYTNLIIQEAITQILEAIYEPIFQHFENQTKKMASNYGFRPNKTPWNAVEIFKNTSFNIAIKNKIEDMYNINHTQLILKLSKRIKDKKFLKMISTFLKSQNYKQLKKTSIQDFYSIKSLKKIHDFNFQNKSIFSILFNIYIFDLDKFIYFNLIFPILKKNKKKTYQFLSKQTKNIKQLFEIWFVWQKIIRKKNKLFKPIIKKQKFIFEFLYKNFKKCSTNVIYSRYGENWLLCMITNYQKAKKIKKKIKKFINKKLLIQVSEKKIILVKLQNGVEYLGYQLKTPSLKLLKKKLRFIQTKKIFFKKLKTKILPSYEKIYKNLKANKFCTLDSNMYPLSKKSWLIFNEYTLVKKYRNIIFSFVNYYQNCNKIFALKRVYYILKYSCVKTIAERKKIGIKSVLKKYGRQLNIKKNKITSDGIIYLNIKLPTLKEIQKLQ